MDRQAIDVHGRIAFSNANRVLPRTDQKCRWRKVRWPSAKSWRNSKNRSRSGRGGHRRNCGRLDLPRATDILRPARSVGSVSR
jgi:hypothetical protein